MSSITRTMWARMSGPDHGGRERGGERRETATSGRKVLRNPKLDKEAARSNPSKNPEMRDVCRSAPLVESSAVDTIRSAAADLTLGLAECYDGRLGGTPQGRGACAGVAWYAWRPSSRTSPTRTGTRCTFTASW